MSVVSVRALSACEECFNDIWADDVFKKVAIPKSPMHLALVFRCPRCRTVGRLLATHEEWETAQAEAEDARVDRDILVRAASVDLDGELTVAVLEAFWAAEKRPPLLEDRIGSCNCEDCKRRLYGA